MHKVILHRRHRQLLRTLLSSPRACSCPVLSCPVLLVLSCPCPAIKLRKWRVQRALASPREFSLRSLSLSLSSSASSRSLAITAIQHRLSSFSLSQHRRRPLLSVSLRLSRHPSGLSLRPPVPLLLLPALVAIYISQALEQVTSRHLIDHQGMQGHFIISVSSVFFCFISGLSRAA